MFGFKKLLRRIKSLESLLDVAYCPSEDKYVDDVHIAERFGFVANTRELIDKSNKK